MAGYPRTISLNGGYEFMTLHSAEHEARYRARVATPSDEVEESPTEEPVAEQGKPAPRRPRRKVASDE